jgi:aminoglycoside/choline kinase family phosphotransferase
MASGQKIQAYVPQGVYWKDIGTPERYREIVFDQMGSDAFETAFHDAFPKGVKSTEIQRDLLIGDGSDRAWYRVTVKNHNLIMVDHGIRRSDSIQEVDAFIFIGLHLREKDVPVPLVYEKDAFSGLVFLEDLGDTHLQTLIRNVNDSQEIISHYKALIKILVHMSQSAILDFDPAWTYQTLEYDKKLILERECRYFIDAYVNGYLNRKQRFENFEDEFEKIAGRALEGAVEGFMHRDFQSRNIMVKDRRYYIIDFQGGRIGPLQYDLASLLIDPYVALSNDLQDQLADYAIKHLSSIIPIDASHFLKSYTYCKITRNLQILGAYGFLTRAKGKSAFEQYIPRALKTLKHHFSTLDSSEFPKLKSLIDSL